VLDINVIDQAQGDGWAMYQADCCEALRGIPDQSVGLSIYSPPFASLYTYTASDRDMGNSDSYEQFFRHYDFVIPEMLRVTKPARRSCVHVQQVTLTKATHGTIGWMDFRADVVRHHVEAGWIYDGEVVIDKNPQAQAIRTKAKALMFVQKNKDSAWSRPAMADYVLLFRAPGENEHPVDTDVSNEEWIQWARPIWYGIRETNTLNVAEARNENDERHICPLQLDLIHRCVRLWSNPGDVILSPFAGIGSEGFEAIKLGRKFIGIELKSEYYQIGVKNLKHAEQISLGELFQFAERGS
jgi:DNA modification methylase